MTTAGAVTNRNSLSRQIFLKKAASQVLVTGYYEVVFAHSNVLCDPLTDELKLNLTKINSLIKARKEEETTTTSVVTASHYEPPRGKSRSTKWEEQKQIEYSTF